MDLVNKATVKGGNIVLMNKGKYICMCQLILNNRQWYTPIPNINLERDSKKQFELGLIDGLLDKETVEFSKVEHSKIPVFYALPKVHKSISDPPGHPINLGVGALTEKVSEYIDRILQPFITNQFSYVKDASHLLTLLHDLVLPPDTILVTLDIEALYSSIPILEA